MGHLKGHYDNKVEKQKVCLIHGDVKDAENQVWSIKWYSRVLGSLTLKAREYRGKADIYVGSFTIMSQPIWVTSYK